LTNKRKAQELAQTFTRLAVFFVLRHQVSMRIPAGVLATQHKARDTKVRATCMRGIILALIG